MAVQGVGHQLLAGTGLAIDQHGDVGVAQPPNGTEHLLHRRGFTDDFRRTGQGLGHIEALLLLRMLVGALYQRDRLIDIERFGQVFESAPLVRRHCAVQVGMGGHDDDRQARVLVANLCQQVEAAGAGHANVGNDHVRLLPGQAAHHAIGAVEALGGHAFLLQGFFQDPADGAIIVDDPYGFTSAHEAVAPCSSGRKIEKAVWPAWLSHSIRPWC
ncbi:hypothetical protein D3C78_788160 [compost metagenome]